MPLDLILMGPPGAGKGTQAQRLVDQFEMDHIATGDILRSAVRAGTPLGLQAKEIMARGDLVPDDIMIGLIRDRLEHDDTSHGFLLDGFPRTEAQAASLDEMLKGLHRGISQVLAFDVELEQLVSRLSGRAVCREAEHVYHLESKPPTTPGVCDLDGSELYQREDDKPEVIRSRYQKQWVEAAAPVLSYYRERGLVDRRRCRQARRSGGHRGRRDRVEAEERMIIRKSDREVETMARAGEVVAETLNLLEREAQPGVTLLALDELAEAHIRSRGGVPSFKGFRGFPGSICASPNAMVVHGIPGPYALEPGDLLSLDVGVTLDGFVADSAITITIGEGTPEANDLIDACYAGLEAAIEQCRAGNRLGDISHAVQIRGGGARASVWCARWSATGSAARCTRSRRSPTTALPAAAQSWPRAWCLPSSR